jgi:kynureninase
MLKASYRTFFDHIGDALHVTAHSHHPWPDVTRAAHLQYWEDSARLTNRKWQEKVFGEAVPEAQGHVARHLDLADPRLVARACSPPRASSTASAGRRVGSKRPDACR